MRARLIIIDRTQERPLLVPHERYDKNTLDLELTRLTKHRRAVTTSST